MASYSDSLGIVPSLGKNTFPLQLVSSVCLQNKAGLGLTIGRIHDNCQICRAGMKLSPQYSQLHIFASSFEKVSCSSQSRGAHGI